MNVEFTNGTTWEDLDGRVAKPNFKQERLIWRGTGEKVYLVGFEKANRKAQGKAGVDYVDWSNPPVWALEALESAGVSLNGTQETAVEEESVEMTIQADSVEELSIEDEPVDSEGDSECPSDS